MKDCRKCGSRKAVTDFYLNAGRADGRAPCCKLCDKAAQARFRVRRGEAGRAKGRAATNAWKKKNAAKVKADLRAWKDANPESKIAHQATRRARKLGAGGKFTEGDILRIHAAQRGKCAYCRRALRGAYEIDHIKPFCLGGTNHPHNLQLTCSRGSKGHCNQRKGRKDPIVFAQSLGMLL